VRIQSILLPFLLLSTFCLFGQHPVSTIGKKAHLDMLREGVLLVRLSGQEKKIAAMIERGQKTNAENLKKEQEDKNAKIVKAFQTHYNFCTVYFIKPQDTKAVIKNRSAALTDIVTGVNIDLSQTANIYLTDYSYGHPAEGNERYNRKGFQIFHLEDGKIRDIGRDLFYAGVKQGFFSPTFDKSLQKTIVKLNRRLENGNKYL